MMRELHISIQTHETNHISRASIRTIYGSKRYRFWAFFPCKM